MRVETAGMRAMRVETARWVLYCPHCNEAFTQSEIPETSSSVYDPFTSTVMKPEFPNGGLSLECPLCEGVSVYQRHQLIYRTS